MLLTWLEGTTKMATYRVRFYQNTYSADHHSIKRLARQVDVEADSPTQALMLAQGELRSGLEADSIEVGCLSEGPHAGTGHAPRAA